MDYRLVSSKVHPFVGAIQQAYSQHRPLTISPDVIWLLLCQGFAKHIELNSEKFRNKIVDFQGVKKIVIYGNDILKEKTNYRWPEIIKQFSGKIRQNIIDTSLYSTIVHSFSTTTEKELIAFEISFLEVNKQYFELNYALCGIPQITLEGNTEDWIWIRNNLKAFRQFEMDWWIDKLIPILDEFIEASRGKINLKFWSRIYSDSYMCGGSMSGWFIRFFPYISDGESEVRRNWLMLKYQLYDEKKTYFRT